MRRCPLVGRVSLLKRPSRVTAMPRGTVSLMAVAFVTVALVIAGRSRTKSFAVIGTIASSGPLKIAITEWRTGTLPVPRLIKQRIDLLLKKVQMIHDLLKLKG